MIPEIVPVNNWTGNNHTTEFDFDFLINSENELKVYFTDKNGFQETLQLNIDYTINKRLDEDGNALYPLDGGSITFPIEGSTYGLLQEDETISIVLDIPIAQTSPYGTSAFLNLQSLEYSLDYITRLIQMLNRAIERSFKVQEGSKIKPEGLVEDLKNVEKRALSYANKAEEQAGIATEQAGIATEQADIATNKAEELSDVTEKINKTLDYSRITNCLLEVPQNIKLELKDGVLTLKAGSKVIVPNGVGKFDEVVIESDLTHTNTANLQMVLCVLNGTSLAPFLFSRSYSGATPPVGSGAGTMLWYDTTNNKMKISTDNGATWRERRDSLPIAIVTADGTSYSSIDQVFNGFGYIGNHIWADKGVKILVANGLNEDGTINNFVMETPFLMSRNAALNGAISFVRYLGNSYTIYNIAQSAYLGELDYIPEITATFQWYFNTNEMKWYMHEVNETKWKTALYYNITPVISATSTAITSFEPYKPFQGVNYSEYKANMDGKVSKSGDTMTGSLISFNPSYTSFVVKSSVIDSTVTPSSNLYAGIDFRDKNDVRVGWLGVVNASNGLKIFELQNQGQMDGFLFPKCTTMPTNGGASTASTVRVAVVVENYVNGTSWYRVWSDGWKEQGGYVISAPSGATVSLLKGFTSTSYHVSAQAQTTSATAPAPNQIITPYAYTTSNFKVALNYTMSFSWYACGY